MDEIAEPLRRTFHTRTAHRCAVRVALHRRAALRAGIRQAERYGVHPAAFVSIDAEDFRNDLPCLAHDDRIADAHVELIDKILIVQRSRRDGRTGKTHRAPRWLSASKRRSGRPARQCRAPQRALSNSGRVFIRAPPSAAHLAVLPRISHAAARLVDLDDSAVNIKGIARRAYRRCAGNLRSQGIPPRWRNTLCGTVWNPQFFQAYPAIPTCDFGLLAAR